MGSMFKCRLIHIWCISECLRDQDGVCVGLTQNIFQSLCSNYYYGMCFVMILESNGGVWHREMASHYTNNTG